ncbi:MAG: ferrochelatase, partial [Mesorhizobium sp.]
MTLANPADAKAAKTAGPAPAGAAPVKAGKIGIMLINLG